MAKTKKEIVKEKVADEVKKKGKGKEGGFLPFAKFKNLKKK